MTRLGLSVCLAAVACGLLGLGCQRALGAEAGSGPIDLAVADFVGPDADICKAITQTFEATLGRSRRLHLVNRSRLAAVLAEQKLQNSGLVDPEKAAEIGKLVGAKKIAVGSFTRVGSRIALSASLVDVETGRVQMGGADQVEGRIEGEDGDIYGLARQLAQRFHRAVTGQWLPDDSLAERSGIRLAPEFDPLAVLEKPATGIKLEMKLDRREGSTYYWGERLHVSFRVDKPCHVYLFNIDTSRQVTLIYPNEYRRDEPVPADEWVQVPGAREKWDLNIEGELGEEEIAAIATTRPLAMGVDTSKGISVVSKSLADFTGKTVVPRLREEPANWGARRIRFFTAQKP